MSNLASNSDSERHFREAVGLAHESKRTLAFTGAGISVESGIPDFRSPQGLWQTYPPMEFATFDVFLSAPEKSWQLFRAIGDILAGAAPNAAHLALSRLESAGRLAGIITQNVDDLHQRAGNENVWEIHGNTKTLHCPRCLFRRGAQRSDVVPSHIPDCPHCRSALKPDIVLFGEDVREMDSITQALEDTDLLLVIGTSAEVYPAAAIPERVRDRGGRVIEFNIDPTMAERSPCDLHIVGPASKTVPMFAESLSELGGEEAR